MAVIQSPTDQPGLDRWIQGSGEFADGTAMARLTDSGLGLDLTINLSSYEKRAGQYAPDGVEQTAARLVEELGEAQAALGKSLRWGFDNYCPKTGEPNISWLHRELVDVMTTYVRLLLFLKEVQADGR